VLRSEPGRRKQLPGRVALIGSRRAGLRAGPLLLALAALVCVCDAGAHGPATAIGRAVEAFGSVSVSYEPGSAVSDVEAGNFPLIVGTNPKVAFMPASASSELAGGPNVIAEEIAGEAALDGTLVVLVGTRLGAWSEDIGEERLGELVRDAQALDTASPAGTVEALVRSVQDEPTGGLPSAVIGVALVVLASGAFVAYHRLTRRRQPAA
jgi:hypothetical protein